MWLVLVHSKQSYAYKTFGGHPNPHPLRIERVKDLMLNTLFIKTFPQMKLKIQNLANCDVSCRTLVTFNR